MSNVNYANLVMGADTRGLLKGKEALEATTRAGAKTEKAVGGTERGFVRAGRGAGAASKQVSAFNKSADRARGVALAATKALAGMAAAYATFQAAGQAISVARDFNAALAETSTLIEGTPQQLDAITDAARSMAKEFGGNATEQVKAYYQALSAGADGVEGATRLLDQANRLAIGGVTDVTTGVDALTTAMNAYGPDVLSAAEASDAMFVAMRAGKTTIGELAGSLGQIVPIASSAGVSFDEVTAGIAALTTQGLSTASATTGLRQVLASVIAPTKQATDAAKALGIEFDVQALKSQGLAGFLDEVIQKAGGNEAAMAQLFGSVEALGAALAFAGGAGGAFSTILTDMETKTGATNAAYEKMAESLDQRWSRITAAASDIALGFGNALLAVVVPAMEGVAAISITVGQNLDAVVVGMTALAATQIPAAITGFAALTAGMSASAVATGVFTAAVNVAKLAVVALGGPLGLIYGILGASAAAWLVWDKGAADGETASYDAAAGTSALLGQLDEFYQTSAPAAGAAAIALANDNYKLAASSFEAAKAELAKRRAYAEGAAANNAPGPVQRNAEMRANDAKLLNQVAAAEAALAQAMRDRKVAANAVTGSMSEVIVANNAARESTKDFTVNVETNTGSLVDNSKAAGVATKAAKDAAKDIERTKDAYDSLIGSLDPAVAASQEFAAAQEAINAALKIGYISAGEAANAMSLAKERLSEAMAEANAASGIWEGFEDSARSAFGSVITGASSAKDAIASLLSSLAGKLADSAFDGLFGGIDWGGGGSKGGLFGGSIIPGILHDGGIAGKDGYGHGRAFAAANFDNAPRYHNGGIAGLKPNEVPAILERGERVIPKGQSGGDGGTSFTYAPQIDARGADAGAVQRLEAAMARAHAEFEDRAINAFNMGKKRRKIV